MWRACTGKRLGSNPAVGTGERQGCQQQEYGGRTASVLGLSPGMGQHRDPAHTQAACVTAVAPAQAYAAVMDPGGFPGLKRGR